MRMNTTTKTDITQTMSTRKTVRTMKAKIMEKTAYTMTAMRLPVKAMRNKYACKNKKGAHA